MTDSSRSPGWEKEAIQAVLLESIKEQRAARRWSAFYRLIILGIIVYGVVQCMKWELNPTASVLHQAHTAIIDVRGVIEAEQATSADNINNALELAFDSKWVRGIILRINSPGGSPVQARQIYDKIQALQTKNPKIKVYSLIEDMGTSAAYLIASATEEIHADKTSIVGSIGVIMEGFGFPETLQKLGIDRRVYKSGRNKDFLDPYMPRVAEQEAFLQQQLDKVHQAFIQNVRDGRKDKLKETPEIFSGLFWSGENALALGLIDGHRNANEIAKELIQAEDMVDYTISSSLIDRIANRIGAYVHQASFQFLGLNPRLR